MPVSISMSEWCSTMLDGVAFFLSFLWDVLEEAVCSVLEELASGALEEVVALGELGSGVLRELVSGVTLLMKAHIVETYHQHKKKLYNHVHPMKLKI